MHFARTITVALFTLATTWAYADTHEVFTVEPANDIVHGLHVQAATDSKKRWVMLRGPKMYSAPASETDAESGKDQPSYLSWFQIRKPTEEAARVISVKDAINGDASFDVTIGTAEYYAMPAQTLSDGPPAEIPEDLNHFLAFRILNAEDMDLSAATPGRPAFLCVPAEEWHHAEHFPIKDKNSLLMVYETEVQANESKTAIIDQFGINKLRLGERRWVYVRASKQ